MLYSQKLNNCLFQQNEFTAYLEFQTARWLCISSPVHPNFWLIYTIFNKLTADKRNIFNSDRYYFVQFLVCSAFIGKYRKCVWYISNMRTADRMNIFHSVTPDNTQIHLFIYFIQRFILISLCYILFALLIYWQTMQVEYINIAINHKHHHQ